MDEVPMVLVELRRAWLKSGLKQEELAKRMGMPRPNVARALSGRHMPTLATLLRLAHALGYDIAAKPERD